MKHLLTFVRWGTLLGCFAAGACSPPADLDRPDQPPSGVAPEAEQPALRSLPEIAEEMLDPNPHVRALALQEVRGRRVDNATAVAILHALDDEDVGVQVQAAQALGDLEDKPAGTVPALLRALRRTPRVKVAAMQVLGKIGRPAASAIVDLVPLLKHDDSKVRIYAAQTIGKIRAEEDHAVPGLSRALSDPVEDVSVYAAHALVQYGTRAQAAVPALVVALEDPRVQVKLGAIHALQAIGPSAVQAVPRLQAMEQTENQEIREAAGYALKALSR